MRSLQVMKIEELGMRVEALPSVKEVPLDYIFDGRLVGARNYKALVDSESGNLVSVVSKSYSVVQNREAFGAVVNTLQGICPDAKIRASIMQEKGCAWMSVVFSDFKAADGADGIEMGFTAQNSYNKSSSVRYAGSQGRVQGHYEFFGLRLACQNGLIYRVPIADWNALTITSQPNAKVGDIVGVEKAFVGTRIEEAACTLAFRHIGRVDRKIAHIRHLVAGLPAVAKLLEEKVAKMRSTQMDAFTARGRLQELGFGPRTTTRLLGAFAREESTEFGLHNAITGYATHGARVSPQRMEEMLVQARLEVR